MISAIRAVTVSTRDLEGALALYSSALGMTVIERGTRVGGEESAPWQRLWGLSPAASADVVWLEQPGATCGAIRLVRFSGADQRSAASSAKPYDYGRVKNLDFFTNDVAADYARLRRLGYSFLGPPVSYPLAWGPRLSATEAHLLTAEGNKIALARLSGAPRKAFGEAAHQALCTEVAAATQIVADFDRAVAFYRDVFDCVPAADTVVDDPGLAAALHLPQGTTLQLCFIGPPTAVGGKIGLVAYGGPGIGDARSLAAETRPPHLGTGILTFTTDALDVHLARARLCGAEMISSPVPIILTGLGAGRAASFLSPDRILHELFERDADGARHPPFECLEGLAPPAVGQLGSARAANGARVMVANVGGELLAVDDACPHLGGPLSHGVLRGREVICPWHAWTIDVTTGRVRGCGVTTRCWDVRVERGRVWVRPPKQL